MRTHLLRTGILALLVPPAYADVVDVSSTTILSARVEARDGQTYHVVPAYELLTLSARDISNPIAEDLRLVVSGWGELDFGSSLRWDNGHLKEKALTGDLDLAYVQGDLLQRALQVRLGRQLVAGGAARVLQLDGAQVAFRAPVPGPVGVGLTGYVGAPVTARFSGWNGETTFNPMRGAVATGGRLFAQLPRYGEVGVSLAVEGQAGEATRRDLGGDIKVYPVRWLTVLASTFYSLYENRVGELDLSAAARPIDKVQFTLDYRYTEPGLFLARNSILSVFTVAERNEVGGMVTYYPRSGLTLDADYHLLLQDDGRKGNRGRLRGTCRIVPSLTGGAEIILLNAPDNTYLGGRIFASYSIQRFLFTADVQDYKFREDVNGRPNSFLTTLSAGYEIAREWRAVLAATAGNTPYVESHLDLMAKVVYTPSFSLREVR